MSERRGGLTDRILASGLVDKATAALMEKWGVLPPGSVEKADEEKLRGVTREYLVDLAEDIAYQVERDIKIRESMLDLNRIRWPVTVTVLSGSAGPSRHMIGVASGVIDHLGRYYFRPSDVRKKWLVPGLVFERELLGEDGRKTLGRETILEVTELFIGDVVAAIQVSTRAE